MARKRKSVALLIETSNAYARGVLRGIASYVHQQDRWTIYLTEQERGAVPPSWINDWNGDGVIARIENQETASVIEKLNMPVVDVSAARHLPQIPCVETDDEAIAIMAFEHLRERGFRNVAYCGDDRFAWSTYRRQTFQKCADEMNISCSTFANSEVVGPHNSSVSSRGQLKRWLKKLPKPVGIFACYDNKGREILDVCRANRIKVPTEVAVIGVDNDELLCDLCTPPLTSIIPDAERAGQMAASILEQLMKSSSDAKLSKKVRLFPPRGIVERQSTDVVAIDDEEIAEAIRFIRDHFCEPIQVNDILDRIPISRRALEHRFRELLGRTPHQEILRRRIDKVRYLLSSSDMPLSQVARMTGFSNQEYLSVAFRRVVGTPPGAYRKSHRSS